jgi:DNA-binding MarR family transcriptional regulator
MAKETHAGVLGKSPYFLLKRAAQFAAAIYARHVGRTGLTARQFTILKAVEANEGASQTALVQITGIDRSTLADVVARLVDQGYLNRRRRSDDARANTVRLSAAGRRAVRTISPGVEGVDRDILAALPRNHRKPFIEALAVLAAKMDGNGGRESAGKPAPRPRRKAVK